MVPPTSVYGPPDLCAWYTWVVSYLTCITRSGLVTIVEPLVWSTWVAPILHGWPLSYLGGPYLTWVVPYLTCMTRSGLVIIVDPRVWLAAVISFILLSWDLTHSLCGPPSVWSTWVVPYLTCITRSGLVTIVEPLVWLAAAISFILLSLDRTHSVWSPNPMCLVYLGGPLSYLNN